MPEILFYHLTRRSLEAVLPGLLEKCLERGWRVVVQTGTDERRDALDAHLWTFSDESFLAHGTAKDGDPARQPVFLTSDGDNPGGAGVRFLVDRAEPPDWSSPIAASYERFVLLFDGNDAEAVEAARGHWRRAKSAAHAVTYWQEGERGGWVRKG